MNRATEEQVELLWRLSNDGEGHGRADLTPRELTALRALLAERAELLKDRAVVDWFEKNQERITLEGSGCICIEPEDQDPKRDWECFQVGDNGRSVHPTIPVNPKLRKAVAYLIDAATPPKSEEK